MTTTKLLPCPFCGCDSIRTGHDSCSSMCVQCNNTTCRAKIVRYDPDRWPRGVFKRNLSNEENLDRLNTWTLKRCIKAWNTRKLMIPRPTKRRSNGKAKASE